MMERCLCRFPQLLLILLLVSACSGGGEPPAATPTDIPPSPFPTFAFVEPTKPVVFDQSGDGTPAGVAANETIALDPTKVARGLGRYEALECGNCHGADGEGSDQAPGLLEFALSEDDFITFVRSGGDLGPRHQYSTDRLSNSGSRNLYQFLVSLSQSG